MRISLVSGLVALAVSALSGAASAHDLSVTDAWARATPGKAGNGAAYLTIRNAAFHPEVLVSASSPVARKVEIHTHSSDGGVMRMRRVDDVQIPLDDIVTFRPGSYHVMLIGLNNPLKEGEKFPLSLRFKSGEVIKVTVAVMGVGSMGPDGAMRSAPQGMPQGMPPMTGHDGMHPNMGGGAHKPGDHMPGGHMNR